MPLHRLRIIGKQVKGLCELVTVYGLVCAYVTGKPGRRADGITVSQETCLPVYRASVSYAGLIREPGPRVTGCTGRNKLNCRKPLPLGSGFVFYPDRRMRPFPAGQLLFLQHAVLRRPYTLQPEHYHSVKFAFTQAGQQIYRHSSVLPAGGGKR